MKKFIVVLAAFAVALLSFCPESQAAITLKAQSLVFNGAADDLIGAGTTQKDGKADASFTLVMTGAQAIREISLKNDTTGTVWSTSSTQNPLIVINSKGDVLSGNGRMSVTPVIMAAEFRLVINDAAAAIPKDSTFTATATLVDGAQTSASATVKAVSATATTAASADSQTNVTSSTTSSTASNTAAATTTTAATSAKDEVSLFETRGTTDQDFAGEKKSVSSNGKNDYRYDANFNLTQNVSVKGLKIVAENGSQKEEWDTIPESKSPVVVVIDGSKNILNKTDGSVSFAGNTNCILLVDDKAGLLSKSGTTSKIYVTLSDGRMLEKTATAGKKVVADNSLTVDFRGTGKYDFVGQSKKLEANMNPDSFVTVTVNAKGKITGVRLSNLKNNAMWDTVPSSSANLAALLTSDGKKLNKADGSVAVEVNGTEEFNIAFDEASDAGTGPYKVTIVFDDGRLMEGSSAASTAAAADTKSAKRRGRGSSAASADQAVAADREVVFTSAKPQSVALDLVGKNKKKGANGAKDMALTIKATGKGTIRTMVLSCPDGTGWDTLSSNNGRWLLGVREGSKLLNAANGTIKLDVNGTKTYQLLMQNNGKLNAKTGKLLLTVTWGDGEVTETELSW